MVSSRRKKKSKREGEGKVKIVHSLPAKSFAAAVQSPEPRVVSPSAMFSLFRALSIPVQEATPSKRKQGCALSCPSL